MVLLVLAVLLSVVVVALGVWGMIRGEARLGVPADSVLSRWVEEQQEQHVTREEAQDVLGVTGLRGA